MTADAAAQRKSYGGHAARSELELRTALEAFCRYRWPAARVVHEIVMGEGRVRADVAAIDAAHIVAIEVKGAYDDTTRLLHQVGMYQLCVPEVWMVVDERHGDDARLIRHLLPSVGLLVGKTERTYRDTGPVELRVDAEAVPRDPVWKCALEMLWAEELRSVCERQRISVSTRSTRPYMIANILEVLTPSEIQAAICIELRARQALWRADDALGKDDA